MSWITRIVQGGLGQIIGTDANTENEIEKNELSRQATSDDTDRHGQDYEQRLKENEQGRIDNIERHNVRLISLETARTEETRDRTPK